MQVDFLARKEVGVCAVATHTHTHTYIHTNQAVKAREEDLISWQKRNQA
jgi:hypothetical protein